VTQKPGKVLFIQTAFPGDVVLSLAAAETLINYYKNVQIHYVVRKGCAIFFENHPFISKVFEFEKSKKIKSLSSTLFKIRKENYDAVICFQRYFSGGFLTSFSGATIKAGYLENPFSRFFDIKINYFDKSSKLPFSKHETERCNILIRKVWNIPESYFLFPRLYPTDLKLKDLEIIQPYVVCAPGSVWFTKRLPEKKWRTLLNFIPPEYQIVLIGSREEHALCENLIKNFLHERAINLAGKISFMQAAAIMKNAFLCIVQDSAPLHVAGAVGAKICAIFGSTVPEFGFGPWGPQHTILEADGPLPCRPCSIHGLKYCPQGHFKCMNNIHVEKIKSFFI